jgi:predicted nuclease of predicted toxin-antitoxin system
MLKIKVDENLPAEVAAELRGAGHDAVTVFDQQLNGHPDDEVAAACRAEGRAVLTLDGDFADIRVYQPADFAGIIVLRLHSLDKWSVLSTIRRMLPAFEREDLSGRLWIVDESTIRIRE